MRRIALLLLAVLAPLGGAEPLVVLHVPDYPPYEYIDEDGRPQGCFIDLYRLVGERLGREVRFVALPFVEELEALRTGGGDVITGMTDTPARRRHYDFAPGLFREENHLISAIHAPLLQTLAESRGVRIGVVAGEVTVPMVEEAGAVPVVHPDYESLIAAAIAGEVDHFTTSTDVAFHLLIREGRMGAFRISDEPILATEFKPAVRKGDAATLAAIQRGFASLSRHEIEQISRRWLPVHRMHAAFPWRTVALWGGALLALSAALFGGAAVINRQLRRRVAEATSELAAVNRTLQGVLDAATEVAIVSTDRDGVIRVFNSGAERLWGYSAAEVCGTMPGTALHDPDDLARQAEAVAARVGRPVGGFGIVTTVCGELGETVSEHAIIVRKDGTRREAHTIVTAVRDEAGAVTGYLGILTDRTTLRQAEEHLARSRKLDALGQLAGGVAHDFNNALAAMLCAGELLESRLDDRPEDRDLARTIVATAERSAALTRKLLAFARRTNVRAEVVDLGVLVDETLTLARKALDPRVALRHDGAAVAVPVVADAGLLQSALLNLIFNARDALRGPGSVRVRSERRVLDAAALAALDLDVAPGTWALLSVSDDGPGIPPEVLPKIFEPFFTTKAPGEGTGLGLAAVYGIARDHGGGVGAVSRPGEGSTFTIVLPLADVDVHEPTPPVAHRGTARILVVDDNAELREVLRRQLEGLGYAVREAAGGNEALALLRAHADTIDLVLLDLVMPDMHGRDVLATLRARGATVPVVICSGSMTDALEHEMLLAGAQAACAKPLRLVELAETMRRVLSPVGSG